jgi:esterase/lipase superfamily enzyme
LDAKHFSEHSKKLDRDMDYEVYGTKGKICLAFPPMGGRYTDFENFGMVATVMPWIESGKLQLVLVDAIDNESWCDDDADELDRINRQEAWFSYVTDELLPTLERRNHQFDKAMVTGCSMGALHAANFFFRRPDLFDTVIGLSGIYNADYFFPNYQEPLVYDNSPLDFLPNMPEDHDWMSLYRDSDIIFCVGQGAWEDDLLASTRRLDTVLAEKGIPAWFDYWGTDVAHDWPWWQKQLPYFMEEILGDPSAKTSYAEEKAAAKKATAKKPAAKKAAPKRSAAKKPAAKKPVAKPASKPAARTAAKPATKPAAKPATKPAVKPAAKPAAKKATPKPAVKPAAKPAAKKATPKPAVKPAAKKPAPKPATRKPTK